MIVVVLVGATLEGWASLICTGHGASTPIPRWDGTYMDARNMDLLELPAIAQPSTQVNPIAPAGPLLAGCRVPPPQIRSEFCHARVANVAHVDFVVMVGILSLVVIGILLLVITVLNVINH
ncbi:uncharacterized protein G2W53_026173 [Senna tora]|uniref:Uncharacterized protein n=1 Tax=Senna tora TaxID=362788 RepID=A0A834TEQ6_9FABA|nr:uncharacterized protein G2W53_026173 [Senna tora]